MSVSDEKLEKAHILVIILLASEYHVTNCTLEIIQAKVRLLGLWRLCERFVVFNMSLLVKAKIVTVILRY